MKSLDLSLRHLKNPKFGEPPNKPNNSVLRLASPHIDSFNSFLDKGLEMLQCMESVQFETSNKDKISISLQALQLGSPQLPPHLGKSASDKVYPRECIERGISYKGSLTGKVFWTINEKSYSGFLIQLGELPIMVKSNACLLSKMTPKELLDRGESADDPGGYFIVNGTCRILRLLIANRRNYPIAMTRKSWKDRDLDFSDKGILMRCVSDDETASVLVLHHLTTGGVKLELQFGKELFFVPLLMVLKALVNYSDRLLYQNLVRGRESDNYFLQKVTMMQRELRNIKLNTKKQCMNYIGNVFREKLRNLVPPWFSNEDICLYLINHCILTHIDSWKGKFNTLCMMTRKLYAFVGEECVAENVDTVSMQEASVGGFVYQQLVKEKLLACLETMKINIFVKLKEKGNKYVITENDLKLATSRSQKLGDVMQSFLATGSLPSKLKCGLMQDTGLTVVLDHLNRQRDLSHLRAIHRGSYFLTMKTILPRRLTGEAWGFICPVHTPDGAPCGLLNHLAYDCEIPCGEPTTHVTMIKNLLDIAMTGVESAALKPYNESLEVVLNGQLVGYVSKISAQDLAFKLRYLKVQEKIYKYTEIVLIEKRGCVGQYPGLFIITSPARMMRPILNLNFGKKEFVGTLEQNYLNVAISPDDIQDDSYTHVELSKTAMLSNLAKLVPFSDCNPNPRNMYQCQMGKQTMGTPIHNWNSQTFNKLYRLQYPQVPLVRNAHYDEIHMEDFCMGFNACLAIVSYTGYDMEDAMVINKCAMERGLGHGQVYKSEFVDLSQLLNKRGNSEVEFMFKRDPSKPELEKFLDESGLPYPGTKLTADSPYYCIQNVRAGSYKVMVYKGEDCIVDKYSIVNSGSSKNLILQRVNITLRVQRYPIIGDKFASRSGQKGIMSRLYPMEDLPFNERGIVPDIIFNPHGIPSRMTAGTLIELVAGKCAAEFGKSFDSSAFEFNDKNPAIDYYGEILSKAGFNYYGEDVLYSGTDGRMMDVKIFEGIVYYQRLRHMTADKFQVRSTGPNDMVTRQPIKGRKRGGAIRFGEMERDCLISHGAPLMLNDRMLHCSDGSKEWICTKCGSLLAPLLIHATPDCKNCGADTKVVPISMPYCFKYLVQELASVGIKFDLSINTCNESSSNYPKVKIKSEP